MSRIDELQRLKTCVAFNMDDGGEGTVTFGTDKAGKGELQIYIPNRSAFTPNFSPRLSAKEGKNLLLALKEMYE